MYSECILIHGREIVRDHIPAFLFFLLNVTFIAFIQSVLLMAFSAAPAYAILVSTQYESEITVADIAFFAIEVCLVVSEFISDGQQWGQCIRNRYYGSSTNL